MRGIRIESNIQINSTKSSRVIFDESHVKREPMLWRCDYKHAWDMGGPITRLFLSSLPANWVSSDLCIDSRTHMLMEGWYPCIPGWHHDDVPRTREDGQPNYFDETLRSEHVMMLVNADICPTEFIIDNLFMSVPEEGIIYKIWDDLINSVPVEDMGPTHRRVSCPNQALVFFNDRTFHRGVRATGRGFRFFIRASRHTNNGVPIKRPGIRNEQRFQSQVYLDPINKGW